MAKLAVDRLVERDGREAPCRTHEIPLGAPVDPDALPRVDGLAGSSYASLAGRYGHAAHELLRLAAQDQGAGQSIVPGHPDLLVEASYAAVREQARTVGDVLFRRTRLGLLASPELLAPGADGPPRVARVMAADLGWDEPRIAVELERFAEEARTEYLAPEAVR
jgi:glycerol-3-phosphate dehydrogenase